MEELRDHRERISGGPEGMPMSDPETTEAMMAAMPTMGRHEDMAMPMDPTMPVTAFCAVAADLAVIDLVIPHHEAAVAAWRGVLGAVTDDGIRAFARRVIDDRAREIENLDAVRAEMTGGSPVVGN